MTHYNNASAVTTNQWIVDSGATSHMTSDADLLKDYTCFEEPRVVRLGDGRKLSATGRGSVYMKIDRSDIDTSTIDVKLQNVLLVPDLACSLFSAAAAADNGKLVLFKRDSCSIQTEDGVQLATGRRVGSLYYLRCRAAGEKKDVPLSKKNEVAAAAAEKPSLQLLHQRLGHVHEQRLATMIKTGLVEGDSRGRLQLCKGCVKGKFTRLPFKTNPDREKTTQVLQLVHTDLCGPMPVPSPSGKRYVLTFLDDWSRCLKIYLLATKDQVLDCFKQYKMAVEKSTGKCIKILRSDGGGEYVGFNFKQYLRDNGIAHQTSAPYSPQQNGAAERMNRTIVEMARTMLYHAEHSKGMWAEAVSHAAYILNRLPTSTTGVSPYRRWFGKDPDLQHLRVWGCLGYAQVPQQRRTKLDAKAEPVRFLGYDVGVKAYRVLLLNSNKVVLRRDVLFQEDRFHLMSVKKTTCRAQKKTDDQSLEVDLGLGEMLSQQQPDVAEEENTQEDGDDNDSTVPYFIEDGDIDGNQEEEQLDAIQPPATPTTQTQGQPPDGNDSTLSTLRRSTRQRRAPQRFSCEDYTNIAEEYALLLLSGEEEPKTYKEAMASSQANQWRAAVEDEMQSLKLNKTWDLTELPAGRKPVGCRWVFRLKRDDQGKVARYKARLVAKGFTQKEGIDYSETFAPVVRFETIRTLIAYAVNQGLQLHQLDVETAFLHGQLEEELYMNQPEGLDDKTGRVCRLRRSLYGLKQSPRCWNQALHERLLKIGFQQLGADACVYRRRTADGQQVLAVYVDDIVLLARTTAELDYLKKKLAAHFKVKDLGRLSYILGVKVQNLPTGIFLSQKAYIDSMLKRFDMQKANPVETPMDSNVVLEVNDGYSQLVDRGYFQQLVGSLLYAAVATRPDIPFAVATCCRFTSEPTAAHLTAAKRVLRYLRGSADYGLFYQQLDDSANVNLIGYSDADWAGDRDTRKSTTGHLFLMANAAVSWLSQRQPVVALSSTEAEYVALSSSAQQAIWLRRLLADLGVDMSEPTSVYEDNQGAICLASNPVAHKKAKHIQIRHHYIRECVADGSIQLHYVPTTEMLADLLTKALPRQQFQRLRATIGVIAK